MPPYHIFRFENSKRICIQGSAVFGLWLSSPRGEGPARNSCGEARHGEAGSGSEALTATAHPKLRRGDGKGALRLILVEAMPASCRTEAKTFSIHILSLTGLGLQQSAPPMQLQEVKASSWKSGAQATHSCPECCRKTHDSQLVVHPSHDEHQHRLYAPSTSPSARVFRTSCAGTRDYRKQPNFLQVLNAEEGIHSTRESGLHTRSKQSEKTQLSEPCWPAYRVWQLLTLLVQGAASARPGHRKV